MLGGLLSGVISGSSKIPLVQKLWAGGGKAGSSNYLGHPVPLIGGEIGCKSFYLSKECPLIFFAIQILPKPRIEAIKAWVNHHDL